MKRCVFLLCLLTRTCLAPLATAGQTQPAVPKPSGAAHHTTTKGTTKMSFDPILLHPERLIAKAPDVYEVKFTTTRGEFVVQVTRAWAPNGADRFYNLVKHGFFNDAAFFRVVPNFMVQFGMSSYPEVTKAWQHSDIKDDPVTQSNKPGYITFAATSAPNSRTTQVFINYGNNTFLDNQRFAPFGQVTSGMDVVQAIYSAYGENPDQSQIGAQGNAYLNRAFPNLDRIQKTTIISPAAPAHTHTAAPATKPESK